MSIIVENLNLFYGTKQILHDICFTADEGDVAVLLGSSGAGKSSLIRCLNLLAKPNSGKLTIADKHFDLSQTTSSQQLIELRQDVGMVFQQYNLWPHLTVLNNLITAPIRLLGLTKEQAEQQAGELLERLGLGDCANSYPSHLSGGQQQRVAIARALMMQPKVLLFDEPTAALDPEITAQIIDIIKELQTSNIIQLVVTHEIAFAKKIASRVIYLEYGKIVESGSAACFTSPQTPQFKNYLSY